MHLGRVMLRLLSPFTFLPSHPFFPSSTPAFGISWDLKFKSVQGLVQKWRSAVFQSTLGLKNQRKTLKSGEQNVAVAKERIKDETL